MGSSKLLTKALTTLALAVAIPALVPTQQVDKVVPQAYIVEFEASSLGTRSVNPDWFYANLSACNISAQPRLDLNHRLFKGVSFDLHGNDDPQAAIRTIRSFQNVKKMWPITLHQQPNEVDWTAYHSPDFSPISKRSILSTAYAPHVMTGVDKLHRAGYTGEGMFIAIIDSGIDYTHPALGGCFGPGCKVVTGFDLVGKDYMGVPPLNPSRDPMDCNGHGTHVAGILAANPNELGFVGVAPNATLGIWKVQGCSGTTTTDLLIQAMNLAYEASPDVISMSMGHLGGLPEDPLRDAAQRIVEEGIPFIAAAGNDGLYGLFRVAAPSNAKNAMSIGSVTNAEIPSLYRSAMFSIDGSKPVEFGYIGEAINATSSPLPVYALSLDFTVTDDACKPLPDTTPDLADYVVLIRFGGCPHETKYKMAEARGARMVFFYEYPGESIPPRPIVYMPPGSGTIPSVYGIAFVDAFKYGAHVTIMFEGGKRMVKMTTNNVSAGKMSSFSSWGPTIDLRISPDISAPGGRILSTYPLARGGYAVMDGTSMSTPFVAGVVALLKQIRGKDILLPQEMTGLLTTTASPIQFFTENNTVDYLASVLQQGGGLINAFKAARSTTLLDHENIALGEFSSDFKSERALAITNVGTVSQTYRFQNLMAATAFFVPGKNTSYDYPSVSLSADTTSGASIHFEPESLTVLPGEVGIVTMYIAPPQGLDASRVPMYSGYISIQDLNRDNLTLPYAGLAGRLRDVRLFTPPENPEILKRVASWASNRIDSQTVFDLPRNGSCPSSNSKCSYPYPDIKWKVNMASQLVHFDIVREDAKDLNTIQKIGQSITGSILNSPFKSVSRDWRHSATWRGLLDDGREVPDGSYKVMVRALKVGGDPEEDDDYERWDSPTFKIEWF